MRVPDCNTRERERLGERGAGMNELECGGGEGEGEEKSEEWRSARKGRKEEREECVCKLQ